MSEEYIVPSMDEWEVFIREAVVVGMKATDQGLAQVKRSRDELQEMSQKTITRSRDMVQTLMKENYISEPPD